MFRHSRVSEKYVYIIYIYIYVHCWFLRQIQVYRVNIHSERIYDKMINVVNPMP